MRRGFEQEGVTIILGDCLEKLKELPDNSVDSCVTDPPYHLTQIGRSLQLSENGDGTDRTHQRNYKERGFMGKEWDGGDIAFRPELWREVLRVLRPGGHLLSFGGSRTHHRMFCAIEDAGFELRDTICWVVGSGFPKSLNVSKALSSIIPVHEQCACGRSLTQTTGDSQGDYQDRPRSDGEQPPQVQGSVLASSPSSSDAPERSHDGRNEGEPGQAPANTSLDGSSDRPSTEGSSLHDQHQSTDSPTSDSEQSGKPSSKSSGESKVERKRATGKSGTSRSDDDLVSSYSTVYPNLPRCKECRKLQIPEGIGTALKPAAEFIAVARKPLSESTVAANVLKHGTGALNIDGCRVGTPEDKKHPGTRKYLAGTLAGGINGGGENQKVPAYISGRWPANLIHDGSDEVVGMFPNSNGTGGNSSGRKSTHEVGDFGMDAVPIERRNDSGSAARFFYCAKASKKDRDEGLEGFEEKEKRYRATANGTGETSKGMERFTTITRNNHPTVKPTELMRYLCRLVTPPGGTVLDPFTGSGSTGKAAKMEGFEFIGIEKEEEYVRIAEARIAAVPDTLL